jgi:cytochrome c peroxidase
MKNSSIILFFSFLICTLLLSIAHEENPFFIISKKDVKLKLPKNFPKPYYTFQNNKLSPEIFVLGRALFYDEILSKDHTVSCASCHQRIAAFSHIDHTLSHGIYGRIGNRNIPSLQNLIWNKTFMWDGGVNHLEIQPIGPITNPLEMDETLEGILIKLRKSEKFTSLFKKAYNDTIISSERMLKSLTQFMGLMISNNSRYDKYISGKEKFTPEEQNGLNLFRSKCASCHTEPLFMNNDYLNNGLIPDSTLKDIGRGLITGKKEDYYLYKVPTLRNIEMTYPYMHDGRFRKLKDVLIYYGSPENHSSTADERVKKIGLLTFEEKQNIISFLKTLTDKEFLYDRRFIDPNFKIN